MLSVVDMALVVPLTGIGNRRGTEMPGGENGNGAIVIETGNGGENGGGGSSSLLVYVIPVALLKSSDTD
jgi:hypothetical protein